MKRGGKRKGAGRPPSPIKTKTKSIRIPIDLWLKIYKLKKLSKLTEEFWESLITVPVKIAFKDAPIGARFCFYKDGKAWVKINNYGDGVIAEWNGNIEGHQNLCSFADEWLGINLESKIILI